tara:strand:- start:1950 stop:2123 length:174 start_codon:yes stop_codon:yes gene_type:complete
MDGMDVDFLHRLYKNRWRNLHIQVHQLLESIFQLNKKKVKEEKKKSKKRSSNFKKKK